MTTDRIHYWLTARGIPVQVRGCTLDEGGAIIEWNYQCPQPTAEDLAIITDAQIADAIRAAKLATITPALMQQAAMLRALLRKHFGPTAETDRAVTAEAVTAYFAGNPDITADEVRDGVLLRELFGAVSAWTGDGTTWSFPWEVLP